MSEYWKKLHIRKNGVITDIKLYTTTSEVGSNYIILEDNPHIIYAKLGSIGDSFASDLRVRKGATIYSVLKQATPNYTVVQYATAGNFSFTVPQGITKIRVTVAGAGGGGSGYAYKYEYPSFNGYNGGRGELITQTFFVSVGNVFQLTVGAGGTKGSSGNIWEGRYEYWGGAGTAGGSSTFNGTTARGGGGATGSGHASPDDGAEYNYYGAVGVSYGSGGLGGNGGVATSSLAQDGNTGWVTIEYGVGIE